jgi:hypothetical protein
VKTKNPDYLVVIKQAADGSQTLGASITALMPETFAWDTANSYEAPFAQGWADKGAMANVAAAAGIRLTSQALTMQLWQGASDSTLQLELEFQTETDPDKDVRQPVLALKKLSVPRVHGSGLLQSPGPQINLEDIGKLASVAGSTAWTEAKQAAKAVAATIGIGGTVKNGKLTDQSTTRNSNQAANEQEESIGNVATWKKIVRNQISIQIGRYAYFDSVVILSVNETWSNQFDARTHLPLHAKVSLQFKPLFLVTQQDLDNIFTPQG